MRRIVFLGLLVLLSLLYFRISKALATDFSTLGSNKWVQVIPTASLRYNANNCYQLPAVCEDYGTGDRVSTTAPYSREFSSTVWGGGKIWYFGGAHSGYPGNDVEVYQPYTNTWTQQYKPNTAPNGDGVYSFGGSENSYVNPTTGEVRPYTVHGWGRVNYDPESGKFLTAAAYCTTVTGSPGSYTCGANTYNLLAFGDFTKTWTRLATVPSGVGVGSFDATLRGTLLFKDNGSNVDVWLYTSAGGLVSRTTQTGVNFYNQGQGESTYIYIPDLKKHFIYATGATSSDAARIYLYDAVTQTTSELTSTMPSEVSNATKDGKVMMTYDSTNKKLLAFMQTANPSGQVKVWTFNLVSTWTDLGIDSTAPTIETFSGAWGFSNVHYDPARNIVWFTYDNGGKTLPIQMWAYRYQPITQVSIPNKTWIKRSMPTASPCPPGGCKHDMIMHNSLDKKLWISGGDWAGGSPGTDSGRQETYSYNLYTDTWTQEYPYCGPSGEIQPENPDETPFVYDSNRNMFWMLGSATPRDGCPTKEAASEIITNKIMQFNPITKKWLSTLIDPPSESYWRGLFAVYDPITDSIYTIWRNLSNNSTMFIFHLYDRTWTQVPLDHDDLGNYTNGSAWADVKYLAIDVENRYIYTISDSPSKLMRYSITNQNWHTVGSTPVPVNQDVWYYSMLIWDSVNKVLLWPKMATLDSYITLYIYHPDTGQWETDAMYQPESEPVRGNIAVFDPDQNVMMLFGGLTDGGGDPNIKYHFLYRYKEITGTDFKPLNSPRNLRILN